jgi:hypothetical protein
MRHFLTTLGRLSEVDGDTVTIKLDKGERVEIAIQYLNRNRSGG